ncbi:ATP-binding protein [Streptomyces sp. NPDC004599]
MLPVVVQVVRLCRSGARKGRGADWWYGYAWSSRCAGAPVAVAAAECRSGPTFLGNVLDGVASEVVDTAQLLVSELVTNAVMHAHTEVEVRAWTSDGRVHVHVSDQKPNRVLVRPTGGTAYAATGRGLAMVEQLASSHGVLLGEDRKTVWFELWPDIPEPPTSGWTLPAAPLGATVAVELVDLPGALHAAAQQHRESLLRESLLAASAGDLPSLPLEDLLTAHDTNHLVSARLAPVSAGTCAQYTCICPPTPRKPY